MSAYAIIETGSKQYRVEPKTILEIEKVDIPEDKKEVTLGNVLLYSDGTKVQVGNPVIKGAKVVCNFLGNVRGEKVVAFKYRRRKASRRKHGHRQDLVKLQVKEISVG